MKTIQGITTDLERAMYGISDAEVVNCTFSGPQDGESALKETHDLVVRDCNFHLRYPLWHTKNAEISRCVFSETCRASLWYDENVAFTDCKIDGPKIIRECNGVSFDKCNIHSEEFAWRSSGVKLDNCSLYSLYGFLMSKNLTVLNSDLSGKYYFQYTSDITIKNCKIDTKDAFWHSRNVTVYDSEIAGEYLGWHSENLKLVRCKITGTQPLCYANNVELIDCTMADCDLAFEHSTVSAKIIGNIPSVRNPIGKIEADGIGEILIDEFARGKCEIQTK